MIRESPVERIVIARSERKETKEKLEEGLERLKEVLREIAKELKEEGVPVTESCRIDMDQFKEVHDPKIIEGDKKEVRERQKEWYEKLPPKKRKGRKFEELSPEEIEETRMRDTGERLEMLKTIIFHKFLYPKFICVRGSFHDDIVNKVDNLILERETGNLVCALDMVADPQEKECKEKISKILIEKNVKGRGARAKYGIDVEKRKLVLKRREYIPIFVLALPKKEIEEGIINLPSLTEISEFEREKFDWFRSSLRSQLDYLRKVGGYSSNLERSLSVFEESFLRFEPEPTPG